MPGTRRNVDERRIATLQLLSRGIPASWDEIVAGVGAEMYADENGDDSTVQDAARYAVHRDIRWLRSVGCEIGVVGNALTGRRYLLLSTPFGPTAFTDEELEALEWLERLVASADAEHPPGLASLVERLRVMAAR